MKQRKICSHNALALYRCEQKASLPGQQCRFLLYLYVGRSFNVYIYLILYVVSRSDSRELNDWVKNEIYSS